MVFQVHKPGMTSTIRQGDCAVSVAAGRDRLRLKIAGAIAVEPALAEPQASSQHFLKHLPLEGTDGRVGLGELIIRTRVLSEHRESRSPDSVATSASTPRSCKQVRELDQPSFPLLAVDLRAINLGESIGHPCEQEPTQLTVSDRAHHLVPEHECQVRIVLPQPLLRLDTGPVGVLGTATVLMLGLANHQARAEQPGQPVANRGGRNSQAGSPFPPRSAARRGGSGQAVLDPKTRTSEPPHL